jgi:hypothetical protein
VLLVPSERFGLFTQLCPCGCFLLLKRTTSHTKESQTSKHSTVHRGIDSSRQKVFTMESSSSSSRRRGRTSFLKAKQDFARVIKEAISRLGDDHGYSRERATRALLQEITASCNRGPPDDKVRKRKTDRGRMIDLQKDSLIAFLSLLSLFLSLCAA